MMAKKWISALFLFVTALSLSCSGPRFRIDYQNKSKSFTPRFEGEQVKLKVYDLDEERYTPIAELEFLFLPPQWGIIAVSPEDHTEAILTVRKLYMHPNRKVDYKIIPRLKTERTSHED